MVTIDPGDHHLSIRKDGGDGGLLPDSKILGLGPGFPFVIAQAALEIPVGRCLSIVHPGQGEDGTIRGDHCSLVPMEEPSCRVVTDQCRSAPMLSLVVRIKIGDLLIPPGRVLVVFVGLDAKCQIPAGQTQDRTC